MPENVDPYFNNVRIGVIIGQHVWDTLIYRDPVSGEFKPLLAKSWKWLDDVTLQLSLRGRGRSLVGWPAVLAIAFVDELVLEAQQKAMDAHPNHRFYNLNVDAGSMWARRLIDQMVQREQPAGGAPVIPIRQVA